MKETGPGKVNDPDFGKRLVAREPDALLDEKLFGHEVQWAIWGDREAPFRKGWNDFGMPFSVPYYTEGIEDAWLIVEELRKRGISLSISSREDLNPSGTNCADLMAIMDAKYQVQCWNKVLQRLDPAVYGKTAPEAICKAALQILGLRAAEAW